MKLIIQPDDGVEPVLEALDKARKSIDIVVFRLDIKGVVDGLGTAVKRGVAVRALIAHTNRGAEKALRKLEARLLDLGVTVARTADDLVRYHGKMLIVDRAKLHVNGFNFTWRDVDQSRSFGILITAPKLVQEALKLFEADLDRQPYTSSSNDLAVSPVNARTLLTAFIKGAKRQLLIYDPKVSDPRMMRLLAERQHAGVDVRIIGSTGSRSKVKAEKYPGKRLHVRAIMRDGTHAFLGSQSLRSLELDGRREIGIVIRERAHVKKMVATFEHDWAKTDAGQAAARDAEKAAKGDKPEKPEKSEKSDEVKLRVVASA